jgi:hypothetical protein
VKPLGEPAESCSAHLHGDAEVTEALKETLGELLFIVLFEVTRAEVMVFDAIAEHEIRGSPHRAGDGKDGFLCAATTLDAEELGTMNIGVCTIVAAGTARSN